jgi:hypothetical protein
MLVTTTRRRFPKGWRKPMANASRTIRSYTPQFDTAKPACCESASLANGAIKRATSRSLCSAAKSSFFEVGKVHRARKRVCGSVFAPQQGRSLLAV